MNRIRVEWLGRLKYDWAHRLQHLRRDALIAGSQEDVLWMVEHDPVITVGRRGVEVPAEDLRRVGIDFARTERGGLATWHGPGQLVGYLLVRTERRGWKVREVIHGIEAGLIQWLTRQEISAQVRERFPGVWVGENKIAAIGMNFHRGVSMHGFALNLNPDFAGYQWITPCGITDGGLTSVHRERGEAPTPEHAALGVGREVLNALNASV